MTKLRILLLLGLFLVGLGSLRAQEVVVPQGQWKAYLSHTYVVDIASDGSMLYVITQGGFFTYDIASREVQSYSTIEGLSNLSPTTIEYDAVSGLVFIGFSNGMINYFSTPGEFQYVTDIYRTEQFTAKTIRNFEVYNGLLYIATDFGIVVYDIAKKETRYSVTKISDNLSGSAVRNITITEGRLYASMESKGLYVAPLSHPNLTQPSAWVEVTGTQGLPTGNSKFVTHTSDLLYAEVDGSIYRKRTADTLWSTFGMPVQTYYSVEGHGDVFTASFSWELHAIYPDSTRDSFINFGILGCSFVEPDHDMWVGDIVTGLQHRDPFGNHTKNLSPAGPNTNYVTDVVAGNGEVYWAPRGKKGPSDRWYDKSGINYFSFREEGMKVLSEENKELDPKRVSLDFGRACYDVATGRTFMGSWGDGIVELLHGDTVRCWVKKKDPISLLPADSSTRVSGLAYDDQGSLWITLVVAEYRLNVMDAESNWHYFNIGGSALPVGILIDDYGNKWINNQGQGIIVLNENGTLADKSDDDMRSITSDGGNGGLPNNTVLSFEKDLDGAIWVGTSEGAVVFYDPGSVFSSSAADASCPLVEGYCLLRDQKVNAIAVDGANRKWFGTDNGVYLMSPDGTKELAHYTIENTPLFDNGVKELCIDQSTGEVFIGTDKGLISLQGESTEGKDTCDMVVFPNPIRADYTGVISIRGLGTDSKVKIANAAGMLVKEVTALGGTATWDGNDMNGNRAVPGIYLILSADDDRLSPCIGKIAVLEQETPR